MMNVQFPIVYRLEHKNSKLGPYRHPFANSLVDYPGWLLSMYSEHTDSPHNPGWNNDGIYCTDNQMLSACLSLKDLIAWFGSYLWYLTTEGFEIVSYQVITYTASASGKQAIFNKDNVLNVTVVTPEAMINLATGNIS